MNRIDENFWEEYQHLKREVIILRQSEVRLNEIRSRYKALMSSKAALIAVLDKQGIFKEINAYGLELLKLDERSVINNPAEEIFMDSDSALISKHARSVVKLVSPAEFVWNLSQLYGPPVKLQVYMEPVKDSTDFVDSAIAVAYDISRYDQLEFDLSELKKNNREIQKLLDDLEKKE